MNLWFCITNVIFVEFGTCKRCYVDRSVKSITGIFACWVRFDYWNGWMVFWLLNHTETCITLSLLPWHCMLKSYLVCVFQALPLWWAGMSGVKMYLAQVQTLIRMRPMWREFISWQCLLAIKLDSDDQTNEDSELVQPLDPSRGEIQKCQWIAQMESSRKISYRWILKEPWSGLGILVN